MLVGKLGMLVDNPVDSPVEGKLAGPAAGILGVGKREQAALDKRPLLIDNQRQDRQGPSAGAARADRTLMGWAEEAERAAAEDRPEPPAKANMRAVECGIQRACTYHGRAAGCCSSRSSTAIADATHNAKADDHGNADNDKGQKTAADFAAARWR